MNYFFSNFFPRVPNQDKCLSVDAAHLQLLHFKTGWVEGLYKELEFSGKAITSQN